MIRNVSYNNKEIKKEINDLVGRPFGLMDKLRNRIFGSQRFLIISCSSEIENLLRLDNNLDHCNIELRSKGIIVRFRSILNTYGWVVPYYKLSIYKSSGHYAFYGDEQFIRIRPAHNEPFDRSFFQKLNGLKAAYHQQYPSVT